jgi:hypothetical protein
MSIESLLAGLGNLAKLGITATLSDCTCPRCHTINTFNTEGRTLTQEEVFKLVMAYSPDDNKRRAMMSVCVGLTEAFAEFPQELQDRVKFSTDVEIRATHPDWAEDFMEVHPREIFNVPTHWFTPLLSILFHHFWGEDLVPDSAKVCYFYYLYTEKRAQVKDTAWLAAFDCYESIPDADFISTVEIAMAQSVQAGEEPLTGLQMLRKLYERQVVESE